MAGSIAVLIASRAVQGVADGVFQLAFGIVCDTLPRKHVPMGISLISATFDPGIAAGLPLGGLLLDHAGLSWLFWIGLAAVPAALGALAVIPQQTSASYGQMDWLGVGLLSAGLVAIVACQPGLQLGLELTGRDQPARGRSSHPDSLGAG